MKICVKRKRTNDSLVNEGSINAKRRNEKNLRDTFARGRSGYNGIRTFAVFTAENPDSQKATDKYNRKANSSLLTAFKKAGLVVIPAKGYFGKDDVTAQPNVEHPYIVLNVNRGTVLGYCGKYQQTSFVFHSLENGVLKFEYWEKEDTGAPFDPKKNPYVKKDEDAKYIEMKNATDDDFYTAFGGKYTDEFKYSIPFSIFNEAEATINSNLDKIVKYRKKKYGIVEDKNSLFEYAHCFGERTAGNGMYRHCMRKAINRGLLGE